MSNLASTTTFERQTLGFFPPEIWSLVLDSLSLREVLLLSETGDKLVCKRVRSCLRRLTLTRHQHAPQKISPTFLSSWDGLQELNLDNVPVLPDGHYYIRVDMLPTTLKSLSMTISPKSLQQFLSPLSEPEVASSAPLLYLSQLTTMKIKTYSYFDTNIFLEEANYEPFGLWIQKLPLLSLNIDAAIFPSTFINYMPTSLTFLGCHLGFDWENIDEPEIYSPQILRFTSFTSLQKLMLTLDFDTVWTEGLLPTSITDLAIIISVEDAQPMDIWSHLPPHLTSLHVDHDLCHALDASKLPRTLQYLYARSIDVDVIPNLPFLRELLTDSGIDQQERFDPSILPKSIQRLLPPIEIKPANWKCLPRSLTHLRLPRGISPNDLEFVPHLPPRLYNISLRHTTKELVEALPCRKSLSVLNCNERGSSSILSYLVNFPSLYMLTIDFECDITPLSQLCAPLGHLVIVLKENQLNDFKLPSSCFKTLRCLNIRSVLKHQRLKSPLKVLPWLSSLPASLQQLMFDEYPIELSLLSNLPICCSNISVAALFDDSNIVQLAHLPHHIQSLQLKILSLDEVGDPLRISLDTLLKSLPRQLRDFTCGDRSLAFEEPVSAWEDIMIRNLPSLPFFQRFKPRSDHHKNRLYVELLDRAFKKRDRNFKENPIQL